MANPNVGLMYPVFAPITSQVDGSMPVYGTGSVIQEARNANITKEVSDNPLYVLFSQIVQSDCYRQTSDKLRNKAEFNQIIRLNLGIEILQILLAALAHIGTKSHRMLCNPGLYDLVQSHKGTAAYEQDVLCVNLYKLLIRMLATALGRNRSLGALYDLEKRLLHSLALNITGY